MAPVHHPLHPNSVNTPLSIRKTHIQNLIDLSNACLLRGELQRATRAWSILIRCREVDWRSRWRWGLALLTASHASGDANDAGVNEDVDIAQWLRTLRVTVPSDEKPSVMHALVLHLIRQSQYREALDELETYLTSYPYLLSGTLHAYAGMLAFYLAQPTTARADSSGGGGSGMAGAGGGIGSGMSQGMVADDDSDASSPHPPPSARVEPPNPSLIRQARGWFVKAQEIGEDEVAAEFIRMIDQPTGGRSPELSEDEDEEPRPAGTSRRKPISLYDMLHPPSSDEDDEESGGDEEDMVDALHEHE